MFESCAAYSRQSTYSSSDSDVDSSGAVIGSQTLQISDLNAAVNCVHTPCNITLLKPLTTPSAHIWMHAHAHATLRAMGCTGASFLSSCTSDNITAHRPGLLACGSGGLLPCPSLQELHQ